MTLEYLINKPILFVFKHLADPNEFVKVHPLIYKCEQVGNNQFRFYEKQKFLGFLSHRFSYIVSVNADANQKIVTMNAIAMGIVKIELIFQLSEKQGKTYIKEDVNLSSILPIIFFVNYIFRTVHKAIFENIENLQ
jgi:carbon monoxide dehydrogenase subunit G